MNEPCPPLDVLVRATSGEDPAAWRAVGEHLSCCAACQAAVRTTTGIVRAWSTQMHPEPPERMSAREAAFRRTLRSHRRTDALVRICRPLFTSPAMLAVLSTLALGAALTSPSTDAQIDALLDRAMLCEAGQSPRVRQHVQLLVLPDAVDAVPASVSSRTSPLIAIREATDGAVSEAWPELTQRRWTDIPTLVEAQGFDIRRPLSAARYRAWRRTRRDRRETVVRQPGTVTLKTASIDGAIREATLALDSATACVVAQTWTIPGVGTAAFDLIDPR